MDGITSKNGGGDADLETKKQQDNTSAELKAKAVLESTSSPSDEANTTMNDDNGKIKATKKVSHQEETEESLLTHDDDDNDHLDSTSTKSNNNDNDNRPKKRPCRQAGFNTTQLDEDHSQEECNLHDDPLMKLKQIWDEKRTSDDKKEAIQQTWNLITDVVNDLVQDGIMAHQELERSNEKLKILNEDCNSKGREIERLRAAEQKSRESIANLLRTIRASNEETKDSSQSKIVEARIRADLLHMTSQRDQAEMKLTEVQRRCSRLNSDLLAAKVALSKVQQEKKELERYQRVALAQQAKSQKTDKHSDLEYYKRKTAELQTQNQGLTAVLAEKNRTIEDIRRQHERSLSQNRLAAYRSSSS